MRSNIKILNIVNSINVNLQTYLTFSKLKVKFPTRNENKTQFIEKSFQVETKIITQVLK